MMITGASWPSSGVEGVTVVEETVTVRSRLRSVGSRADHDVSEVRAELGAHTQTLNALCETQLELSKKVNSLDDKVTKLDDKVTQGFDTLAAGMAQIRALLTANSGLEQS